LKVLLDHNVPVQLSRLLTGHEAFTAREMLWDLLENGELLKTAEEAAFNVMVSCDQSIFYQQNNDIRRIALVVLSTNDWPSIARSAEAIRIAIARALPRGFEFIPIPIDHGPSRR
jgi:hypothetical protein